MINEIHELLSMHYGSSTTFRFHMKNVDLRMVELCESLRKSGALRRFPSNSPFVIYVPTKKHKQLFKTVALAQKL